MVGVEIDFVLKDSLAALALYQRIFDLEVVEASNLPVGENEVVFTLYGTRFHMLDENPEFGLVAPKEGTVNSFWFNVAVEDIKATHERAQREGVTEIQPLTEMPEYGVSNSIFSDPFGYVWMLHQIHEVVSHEERLRLWEEGKNK